MTDAEKQIERQARREALIREASLRGYEVIISNRWRSGERVIKIAHPDGTVTVHTFGMPDWLL